MTETIPQFAPGCFGSALAYEATNAVCAACVFNDRCRPLHEQNLAVLRVKFNIRSKQAIRERTPEEIADPSLVTTLPKKTMALVEFLDRSALRITERLAAGENPFGAESKRFLHVAAHLLLKRPITTEMLAYAYTKTFAWAENTARAHARIAIQALTHIGAVDEINGSVSIRRNTWHPPRN